MTWRKSTASCDDGASCVWVDVKAGMVLVKGDDPDGQVLMFTAPEWDAFLAGAKAGEFDLEARP